MIECHLADLTGRSLREADLTNEALHVARQLNHKSEPILAALWTDVTGTNRGKVLGAQPAVPGFASGEFLHGRPALYPTTAKP